jgi:hypothetical protein
MKIIGERIIVVCTGPGKDEPAFLIEAVARGNLFF